MAIALVQSSEGTSTLATTTATLSVAPTSGNLVVIAFCAGDYNASPNAGWTESTGMAQDTGGAYQGSYLWWQISNGTNSFPYTIGSAQNSSWVVAEFSGNDATPYDISSGQYTNTALQTYTTPSIVPTTGDRVVVAAIGGLVSAVVDMSADMHTWLNSFTHIRTSGPAAATGDRMAVGLAYLLATGNGSTGYSTGATYPNLDYTPISRSGLIISFKASAGGGTNVTVNATGSTMSMTAGNVGVTTGGAPAAPSNSVRQGGMVSMAKFMGN